MMKYIVHMSEDEFHQMFDAALERRIRPLEEKLAYLTEQRDCEFLKIDVVSSKLSVSSKTVRNWVRNKKLKCHWIGDRQFFLMRDVMAAMRSNF